MDINKFTQKSQEAIQRAQELTIKYENPQIEELHLHLALMTQEEGLIPKVLSFMGEKPSLITADVEREVKNLPKQYGDGSSAVYPSRTFSKILLKSEDELKKFGDEYVGVEHLYIALLKEKNIPSEKIFKKYNINLERFLELATRRLCLSILGVSHLKLELTLKRSRWILIFTIKISSEPVFLMLRLSSIVFI